MRIVTVGAKGTFVFFQQPMSAESDFEVVVGLPSLQLLASQGIGHWIVLEGILWWTVIGWALYVSATTFRSIGTKALFVEHAFLQFFLGDVPQRTVLDLALLTMFARRHSRMIQLVEVRAIVSIVTQTHKPMSTDNSTMFLFTDFSRTDLGGDGVVRDSRKMTLHMFFEIKFFTKNHGGIFVIQ
jgi:hypothetical protein